MSSTEVFFGPARAYQPAREGVKARIPGAGRGIPRLLN